LTLGGPGPLNSHLREELLGGGDGRTLKLQLMGGYPVRRWFSRGVEKNSDQGHLRTKTRVFRFGVVFWNALFHPGQKR